MVCCAVLANAWVVSRWAMSLGLVSGVGARGRIVRVRVPPGLFVVPWLVQRGALLAGMWVGE